MQDHPAVVPFALVPSAATQGLIDFSTRNDLAIHNNNTRSLYSSVDERFDLDAQGLQTFLSLVHRRADNASWDLQVPTIADANGIMNGPFLNLIRQHGEITLQHLQEVALLFIDTPTRAAQDNMMFVDMLLESLSLVAIQKVTSWRAKWNLNTGNNTRPSAMCLLKVIIQESYIDTDATNRILREQLSSLHTYLEKCDGRIPEFNRYGRSLTDQLAARGEQCNDLVGNLFKGYLSSHDRIFRSYIEKKQEDYDEGNKISADHLMFLADNRYKTLVMDNKWCKPTEEDKKIIALQTQIHSMTTKKVNGKIPAKGKKPFQKNKYKAQRLYHRSEGPGSGKRHTRTRKSKSFNRKPYWWCDAHKKFVEHKPEECRLAKALKSRNQDAEVSTTRPSSNYTPLPSRSAPSSHSPISSYSPMLQVTEAMLMEE